MTPPNSPAGSETAVEKKTVTIEVDGREIEANPGELLIAAAERNGVYIPRFCYHPRMEPVGMCRMCLVNVEGPRGTSMQVSCMLTVAPGMKVDTQAADVKKAQDGVLEFLLVNHPLDCPVCDKGGECPLQDQTLAFGPGETRFVEEKRHYQKPIMISPLVELDRERCILCDRCTRFSKDVAGDALIHFQDRGNQTQVNTFPDHPFASYFSGNTVQICPVGALTSTPYRFKARPWDLEQVESTCTSCSVGCRVAVQSSSDKVSRYVGLDAEPTNHGWLCDKGRFDYESLNSDDRLTVPTIKKGDATEHAEVSWGEALEAAAAAIQAAKPSRIGVIGGSRLANEDAYVWAKLAKSIIGTDNVDAQLGDGLPAASVLGVPRATIDEACNAKAVVLLAPDLKEELPVFYLRLREAALKGLTVIEISPQRTSFTEYAKHHLAYRAGEAASVVQALVGKNAGGEIAGLTAAEISAAKETLQNAGDVVVVAGRQSVAESSQSISEAIGLFAQYSNAKILPALRRSNVFGALDMGLAPGMLPGRVSLDGGREWFSKVWEKVPSKTGFDTTDMLRAAAGGDLEVLILLGADPLSDFPDHELAHDALTSTPTVIAIDTLPNASVKQADIVLPAAAYAERPGTTTNIEGRITGLGQKVTGPGVTWPDWVIAVELANALGTDMGYGDLSDIWTEIEALAPSHRGITEAFLAQPENRDGVVAPLPLDYVSKAINPLRPSGLEPELIQHRVTEASAIPPVDGYGVRLVSSHKLYDLGTHTQFSPHLADLISDASLLVHPATLAPTGIADGGRVQLRGSKGTAVATVKVDESVPRGVVIYPFNTEENGPASLIDSNETVTNVRLETV